MSSQKSKGSRFEVVPPTLRIAPVASEDLSDQEVLLIASFRAVNDGARRLLLSTVENCVRRSPRHTATLKLVGGLK